MTWYDEKRLEIQRFAKEQNMKMYDVARIAKTWRLATNARITASIMTGMARM